MLHDWPEIETLLISAEDIGAAALHGRPPARSVARPKASGGRTNRAGCLSQADVPGDSQAW
jgi:hypothetical protein